jgi:TonB family protein
MSQQFIKKVIILFLITLVSSRAEAVESTTLMPIGEPVSGMPVLQYTSKFKVPVKARKSGACGWVDLEFDVSKKGKVKQPKVISSSHSYFESSAIKGIKRVFYKPAVDHLGLKTSFKAMRVRVSYFLKEGCEEIFPDKASNYVATHCLKIHYNRSATRDDQVDYYVKNTCSYPVIAAACISGDLRGVGTCKYHLTLEPKKRRWLKFGFIVTARTKVSKQGFACKLDKQKNIRMVDVDIHKFRGTLTAACRGPM